MTAPIPDSEGGLAFAEGGLVVTEPQHDPQHDLFLDPFHQVESRRLQRSNEPQPTASGEETQNSVQTGLNPGFLVLGEC